MNYETSINAGEVDTLAEIEERSRKRRALIIGAVVVVLAAAIAFMMFGRGGSDAAADADKGKTQAPHVTVVTPGRQAVARTVSTTGSLGARIDMPVGVVGEGGMVTRVLVQPGTWVKQGQVLASIERSVQSQQAASLQAQINVARANARLADQELARAQQLVSRGFVSKADVDRRIATRDQNLAQVRVAEAQYREALNRNARLDIRAPAAGLVLSRAVEPGQVVSPGSGTLFRIAKGGEMEMLAQLAEADLVTVHTGAQASVTPVGSSDSIAGQVWQVSPVIDPQTRQGIVRIAIPYSPAIRPGGFAQASITTGAGDAPVLPESAVLSDAQGNYVYVVNGENKIARRPVKTGQVTEQGIAIPDGLNGTERVVLSAGAFVNPGQTVVPERAPAAGR